MRIVNIYKRVGQVSDRPKYKATIDYEIDVTKYSDKSYRDRFKTGVFTVDKLSNAINFELYQTHLHELNTDYIKKKVSTEIADIYNGLMHLSRFIMKLSRFAYRVSRVKTRKLF